MRRVIVVVLLVLTAVGCATRDEDADTVAAPEATDLANPRDAGTSADGAGSSYSCVEGYSVANLAKRDFAFEGTIRAVDPGTEDESSSVTFDVTEWFKGGTGSSTTKKATGFGQPTSAGGGSYVVGDRLLVAGEDDHLWECGFTQKYTAEAAAGWADTFGE